MLNNFFPAFYDLSGHKFDTSLFKSTSPTSSTFLMREQKGGGKMKL